MADYIVTVLDTTEDEAGPAQAMDAGYLKDDVRDGGTRFFVDIGSGDTVLIEGKAAAADSAYSTLLSITATGIYDVKLAPVWRASRSVDGGGADSLVRVVNLRNATLVEHT
jgi:hypothetical protein